MDHPHTGYIRTPSELDAAFRALERSLGLTSSPQRRLRMICEFYSHARLLPDAWLTGYILFLAPAVLELVRLPYIRNYPPGVWADAYDLVSLIERQPWAERHSGIPESRQAALEQVILAHGFVSSLRELHGWLTQQSLITETLVEKDWSSIFSASTNGYGLFQAYVRLLESKNSSCTEILLRALGTWGDYRRAAAVSVILLDEEADDRQATGRVLLMDIHVHGDQSGRSHITNALGDSGHQTVQQLRNAEVVSDRIIHNRFSAIPPKPQFIFSLHESSAELVGESLGVGAVAGLLVRRTQQMNLRERWSLPSVVACTGSIDAEGNVAAGSWESVERKLQLAFHSPVERVVLPAVHREAALHALQRLQRDFPNRALAVIGVSHVADLPETGGVFQRELLSSYERLKKGVGRHSLSVSLLLMLILLAGGSYLVYLSFYAYPNLEHTRGARVGMSAVVYNPKDSLRWCFRDEKQVIPASVPFGDLEVGDGFTRTFSIWNMTPTDLRVRICIEGPDSVDWYLNRGAHDLRISSVEKADFSVMYNPRSPAMQKEARIVLRDPGSQDELYALELSGSAGKPQVGGYALHFDGRDDVMHFGRGSTAFDLAASATREMTFECWFRPSQDDYNFMLLHNGFYTAAKNEVADLYLGFDSLRTIYYLVGSNADVIRLKRDLRPLANAWNHLALAVSIPQRRIALYLNGEVIEDRIDDFLIEGIGLPHVTIGAYDSEHGKELLYRGDLDEVRLWHRFRTIDEIRRSMGTALNGLTDGLMGYWNMDTNVESIAFNANKRAHSASLLHRPTLVRSDVPLHTPCKDVSVFHTPAGESALELHAGRYLSCSDRVLPRFSEATFSLWFLQTSLPAIHFNYVRRHDGWISIEESYTYTRVQRRFVHIAPGWRHAAFTVDDAGLLTLYIDGVKVDTTRVTMTPPIDWHEKFEGMLLGFRFDKENQLHSRFYDQYFPALSHPRSYRELSVWKRQLSEEEIRGLAASGEIPGRDLVAFWPLDAMPDGYHNFVDVVAGARLHVKRVCSWEQPVYE